MTVGDVKSRIVNAKKDPTYLLAEVEIVATFKLANINRKGLEALLQKFFGSARLDLELQDRFGVPVKPKEWFLVPLEVIEEVMRKSRKEPSINFDMIWKQPVSLDFNVTYCVTSDEPNQ